MKQSKNILPFLSITVVLIAGCATRPQSDATGIAEATQPTVAASPAVAAAPAVPAAPTAPAAPALPAKSDLDLLQGTWNGKEISGDSDAPGTLVIKGNDLDFRGSNPNDWYKGTITVREGTNPRQCVFTVKECASPDYVGKTSNGIYKVENGVLTIVAKEPGNPDVPAGFDTQDARRFEFRPK